MATTLAPGTRVAVIDDDLAFRTSLELLLRSAGLDVTPFRSAQEYLDRPPVRLPDCVLVDLELPGPSGLDLQRHLAAGDGPPVVFLSGTADVASSVRAMRGGAVDFLTKPFEPRDLFDALERAVARGARERRARDERARARERVARLTPRERQVADLVAQGLANKEIAALLGVGLQMVKVHRGRAMQKLLVESPLELARVLDAARDQARGGSAS